MIVAEPALLQLDRDRIDVVWKALVDATVREKTSLPLDRRRRFA